MGNIDIGGNYEKKIVIHNQKEWEKFKKYCNQKGKTPEKYLFELQREMKIPLQERGNFGPKTIKYLNGLYKKQKEGINKIGIPVSLSKLKSEIFANQHIELTNEDNEQLRKFVLPVSTLFDKKATNESLQAFNETVQASQEKIEDWLYKKFDVKDGGYITRLLFLSTMSSLAFSTGYNMSIVQHEWAHGKTAKLNGASNISYGIGNSSGDKTLGQLFINGIIHPFSTRYTSRNNVEDSNRVGIIGAGLNMQENIAKKNNKKEIIHGKSSSLSSNINYLLNKSGGLEYSIFHYDTPGSDIRNYIDGLNRKGIKISKKDIIKYQAIAFLLSGGSWNSFNNLGKFIKDGSREHKNINLIEYNGYKFSLPELSTFMNSDNFSLEIMEYISHGNVTYEFGFETPVIGKGKNTYTIGINKEINGDSYSGKITTNTKATQVQLRYTKEINENSSIELYGSKGFGKTNAWKERADENYGQDSFGVNYILKF